MEGLIQIVRESFRYAVHSTAEYAIEMDPAEAKLFREHLRALGETVAAAHSDDAWKALQASFRGELRDYHDQSTRWVTSLRQQIQVASEAVQLFAENVTAIDSDHEAQLKGALRDLNTLANAADSPALEACIRVAVGTISDSIELMRRRHQTAVAELRQEIRVLHKHIESGRKTQALDSTTGAWNRSGLQGKIDEMFETRQPFCVLVVGIRNLPRLDVRYSRAVVDGALRSLLQRFTKLLTEGAAVGRWDDQNFAAILHLEPTAASALSRLVTKNLTADYSVNENGAAQSIWLQASAGVVDRSHAPDAAALGQKVCEMTDAIRAG